MIPTSAPGPVPADPTHGPDRYIRCPPPSECALGWEWEVTVRVEAVAKLARAEIAKLRAENAALRRQVTLSPADAKWLCDWLHGEDVEHDYDRAHTLLESTDELRRQAADELSREGQGMGLDGESVIEWGYRDKVVLRTVVTTPWVEVPAEEADRDE